MSVASVLGTGVNVASVFGTGVGVASVLGTEVSGGRLPQKGELWHSSDA
ncbi:MAG: hypothetical protein AAF546_13550 [Verrucomicrobiota bacterium]